MPDPRPFDEWYEDVGDVLWWLWPIEQPPYVGSPLDCGHTVDARIDLRASEGHREKGKLSVDVGGWPWRDADEETQARLFWTPLPEAAALDVAIRDHIRGGPDPMTETDDADLQSALRRAWVAGCNLLSEIEAAEIEFESDDQDIIDGAREDLAHAERVLTGVRSAGEDVERVAEAQLASAVKSLLPIGDASKPDSHVFPIYVRMGELRAVHDLVALSRGEVDRG